MSEAITKPGELGLANLQGTSTYTDDAFAKVGGSRGRFLSRLQLFTSNSKECKKGLVEVASYGIMKGKNDPIIKMGKDVVVTPLAWRAKAIDFRDPKKTMAYHNPKSAEFIAVREVAEGEGSDKKCMFGPEFLLHIEGHGFVTFMMGSITARNEATVLRPFITDPPSNVVLSAQYIETDKYSWHGPKVTASDQPVSLPATEQVITEIRTFLAPKDSVVEEEADNAAVNNDR